MAADYRLADYLVFLTDLSETGKPYFLEGGQAVNFWAEYFSAKDSNDGLAQFRPFTSKDCDIWISLAVLRYIEGRTDQGTLVKGNSPADGQIGILTLKGTEALRVDLMTSVYGIRQRKIEQVVSRAIRVNGVSVMDPILLFQSKCHCLLGLDQAGRQDEKHLGMLCALMPMHVEEALKDGIQGKASERALINEVKLLQRILKAQQVKRALELIEVPPAGLLPVERLRSCGLEKVEQFAARSIG
jgi:hypothetical protein